MNVNYDGVFSGLRRIHEEQIPEGEQGKQFAVKFSSDL